ncbi:MAG: hypothetical protein ACR5LA_10035 [Wolbachia sp.]
MIIFIVLLCLSYFATPLNRYVPRDVIPVSSTGMTPFVVNSLLLLPLS